MDAKNNTSPVKKFIRNIIVVDLGLLCVAGFILFVLDLNFGLILLLLGILVAGIGASLAQADPIDPHNPQNRPSVLLNTRLPDPNNLRVNETLTDRISYYVEHSVPRYAIENVMTFAGLITTGLGVLVFLIIWMISK